LQILAQGNFKAARSAVGQPQRRARQFMFWCNVQHLAGDIRRLRLLPNGLKGKCMGGQHIQIFGRVPERLHRHLKC
jgi:hypothetical protein